MSHRYAVSVLCALIAASALLLAAGVNADNRKTSTDTHNQNATGIPDKNTNCSSGALGEFEMDTGRRSGSGSADCQSPSPQMQPCPSRAVVWGSGNNCGATLPTTLHGNSSSVTNTRSGYQGTASFSCANGAVTANPGATCTVLPPDPCHNMTVTWGPGYGCTGNTGVMDHGVKRTIANTDPGYTGSAEYTCNDGTPVRGTNNCTAVPANCDAANVSWSSCSGTAPPGVQGDSRSVSNTNTGYSGSASYSCSSNGTWVRGSYTCNANPRACTPTSVTWGTTNSCRGSTAQMQSGTSQAVVNTEVGYTGNASYSCNNGNLTRGTNSCTPAPTTCPGGSVSWSSCSGTVPAGTNNQNTTVTNTRQDYTGSRTYNCSTTGSWVGQGSGSCTAIPQKCTSQSVVWGSSCRGTAPETQNGGTTSVVNTTSGYTGNANYSCSNGTFTRGSFSCNPNPSQCQSSTATWGSPANCSGPLPPGSQGTTTAVANTRSGYTGNATYSCGASGTWTRQGSGTCNAAPNGCDSASVTWGSACRGTVPTGAQGGTSTAVNTTTNYTGSANYSCSAGGYWTRQGTGTCNQNADPTSGSCSANSVKWGPNASCGGNTPYGTSGQTSTVVNTSTGYSGNANFQCSQSTWFIQGSGSCTAADPGGDVPDPDIDPPPTGGGSCAAGQTLSWNACSARSVAGTPGPQQHMYQNSSPGYFGKAMFNCTSSGWKLQDSPTRPWCCRQGSPGCNPNGNPIQ